MATLLLSTKFNIPPTRPDLVSRPRLIEKINSNTASKLILLSAPVGFGKTTLLSTWVKNNSQLAAWVSLDEDDNDAIRFLNYTVAAFQRLSPKLGEIASSLLQSQQNFPVTTVLTSLLNDLQAIPNDFYFILDDYHVIEVKEIHEAVQFLLDHLPQQGHILIATRSDPPFSLSRMRARGELTEIRQEDLRFTSAESQDYLGKDQQIKLTRDEISLLETRTEGWIAGLQLAALSLRQKTDPSAFIQAFSGSHRYVIDYLADEVLSHLPRDLYDFLRDTSILSRLTPSLCNAVTGCEDSRQVLRELEEANLFLIPFDDQREWYRYHHLLKDVLQTELEAENRKTLNKKAAEWCMSHGLYPEGVKYAQASGESSLSVQMISMAAAQAFNLASFDTLLRWIDALPEKTILENSELATYKSFVLFLCSSIEQAIRYAQAAEAALHSELPKSFIGRFLSLKAHIALCGDDLDECVIFARESLNKLDKDDFVFRKLTLNILGQALNMQGEANSASDVYYQAFMSERQSGDQIGELLIFSSLIFSLNELGRRNEALALCQQLIAEGSTQTVQGFSPKDAVYLSLGLLSYETNDLDLALEQVQRALNVLSGVNFSVGVISCLSVLASIYLAKGDIDSLLQVAQEGTALGSQIGPEAIYRTWFSGLVAQYYFLQGDLDPLTQWAKNSGFSPQDRPQYIWTNYSQFTYIRLLIAQGKLEAAQTLLNTIQEDAENGRRQRRLITSYLLNALIQLAYQEPNTARVYLEWAIKTAASEGYRRAILDEGQQVLDLLPQVRSTAPRFVDEVLADSRFAISISPQAAGSLNPLTERELEVLKLVSRGFSNRQIAETLFVSVGTAKKHLNNIFQKLYVTNRTQAVNKGRESGLIK